MSIKKIAILVMIGVGALTTVIVVPIVVLSNKEDQKDPPKNIKIKEMQTSLNNLNLILPKGKDYSDETKILRAIKTALETRTNIDASHTTFITSKTLANNKISLVAIHSATPTLFTIVVGGEEFILKLNQAQYTLDEHQKINKLKASLSNLKIILPKNGNYRNETQIFKAIKIKLETRDGIDASHIAFITSKTSANSKISSVAIHGDPSTKFTIVVGNQEFILQLNQAQHTSRHIRINELKVSLNNLKVILPKGQDYSNESLIFEAIKIALKARVGIDDSHIPFITSKPLANSSIASVAAHRATPTSFVVIVSEKEFILKLNQAQYDANEMAKINELKNSLNNLKIILSKGQDYSNESNILEAIKIALKARVGIDDSHIPFITSKQSANSGIASVAAHGATPTQFIVIVNEKEFILKLNQAQYDANEIAKINELTNSLNNLKLILPKGEDYSNESNILEAIKIALKARVGIDDSHIAFMTSKPSANSGIALVAAHGATSTSFVVIVSEKEFILKLNQSQYDANEITKINQLKNSLNNLKVILPKGQDYSNESLIFEAIKIALKARVGIDDSHIPFITSKPSANSGIASVAAHGATPTQFIVIVNEKEFILKLNQAQYDANEIAKINELTNSLNNLKLILPKGEDYSNESNILEAIKIALKARVGIDDSHIPFITSKPSANSGISLVATHGATPTQFIVIVGEKQFILQLNQAQYTLEETKINKMQASLSDLNLIFPNDGNYGDETKILEAIKIALQKREGIDASHTTFITSKTLANSGISSIATHEATPTPFTINVGDQEFVLKLKLSPFTLEQTKINELKTTFNNNLNVSLPKGQDYSDESKVFEATKVALKKRVGIDDSHIAFITSKASANGGISSVAAHGVAPTQFIVIVNGEEFILQLNQDQYDANEKAKIDELKNSLNNLKVILPKGGDYNSASKVFEATKVALKKRVGIDASHIAFITSKASANGGISLVAAHGVAPTQFIVIVNGEEFILQLNQAQYDANEKAKIDELKNSLNNLKVILPKSGDYNSASKVFEATKVALKKRVGIDDSHIAFITSKASANGGISLVAAHGVAPTQFIVIVDGQEFILQLNQAQYDANEKAKIDELKNSLNNLKVILPKSGDYNSASNIFEATKVALKKRVGIDDSHIAFITSKASANGGISLVAAHGVAPTQFIVIVNGEEFILQLNQDQYDANEKAKIDELKNSLNNLKVILPKGGDYNSASKVFEATKVALKKRVGIDASHIAFITSKASANGGISLVAAHGVAPTQFIVIVNGEEFILQLNQAQYDANEKAKIDELKNSLNNLKVILPKSGDYNSASKVFEATKVALKKRVGIDDSHIAFITSKASANGGISLVAAHGVAPTQFIVIVDGQEFILQLNQAQYDANEKAKIDELKNSLNNLKVILPKSGDYNSASNIFEATKVALKKRVGIDDSHIAFITSKASANGGISLVAAHGVAPTQFIVIVNGEEFILQLNQAQYDANEMAKINELKNSLNNLKVILPKSGDYNSASKVFEATKVALKKRVGIDDSHIAFITSKASANGGISLVAAHGVAPTQFIVIVDGQEFILQLNQAQYDANEKAKIDELKNSLNNLKVILPKSGDYNSASNIFEATKVALKKRVGIDDSHIAFITSKASANGGISLVAAHGVAPTQFIVIVNGEEFILQLNQAQYDANEMAKINELTNSLNNLKVILPKGGDYNSASNIFEATKVALKKRVIIDDSHIAFMTSKASANGGISSVAAHGVAPTQFIVIVNGEEFILQLNQDQYDASEKAKINELKNSLRDLKVTLPEGEDYSSESNIFEATKVALKKRDGIYDSHLDFMTSKPLANSGIASVASYGTTPTLFIVIVDSQEFILQLNQKQSLEELNKIYELNDSLRDLKVMLPKGQDYNSESLIFEAVKTALKARVRIDASHIPFITSKASANSGIASIAAHGTTPTLFIVIVDGQEFILQLNQYQYNSKEITKIIEMQNTINFSNKIIVPKGDDYSNESNIFKAVKIALKKRDGIDDSHLALMTSKTSANSRIASVAAYEETSTQFTILFIEEEFVLQLNQSQFTLEQTKISELRASIQYSLYINIPKGDDYSDESKVFEAVKTALKKRGGIDDSHLAFMTSKTSANSAISSVVTHEVAPTQFIVIVDGEEFILKLNQSQFTLEQTKINDLISILQYASYINIPKGDDYSNESKVFEAVKTALKKRDGIDDSHLAFMTSKTSANGAITSVAAYGVTPTQFIVIVDGEELILKLNQSQFTLEQTKISKLRSSLQRSLYINIPKGDDYSDESKVFEAVKTALKKRDGIDDSHLAFMTSKTSANSAITSVVAHWVTPTQFIVIVDGEEFILKLNQAEYTILEKFQQTNKIKETIRANLNLIMPKKSYDNFYDFWFEFQNQLYEKDIPYDASNEISYKDNTITEIAPHGVAPTLFPIAYGGEYFVFKLNQAE